MSGHDGESEGASWPDVVIKIPTDLDPRSAAVLREIVERNGFVPDDVASALFTVTPDLVSEFPAAAARRMGWTLVPLLNFTEIGVPGRLERCIRVLIHINTELRPGDIQHVYLEGATGLRPDLSGRQ